MSNSKNTTRKNTTNLDVFNAWMNGESATNRKTHLTTNGKNLYSHGVRIARTLRTGEKLPQSMNHIARTIAGARYAKLSTLAEWGVINVNTAVLKHAATATEIASAVTAD